MVKQHSKVVQAQIVVQHMQQDTLPLSLQPAKTNSSLQTDSQ